MRLVQDFQRQHRLAVDGVAGVQTQIVLDTALNATELADDRRARGGRLTAMSFILDALRKSEHERQRQTGPALVEVAVAAPKPNTNRWATAAIALLLVNLVAIGVLLLMQVATTRREAAAQQASTRCPGSAPDGRERRRTGSDHDRDASPQASVTQTLPEPQRPPMLRPAAEPPVPAPAIRSSARWRRMPRRWSPKRPRRPRPRRRDPPRSSRRGAARSSTRPLPEAGPTTAYPPPSEPAAAGADPQPAHGG